MIYNIKENAGYTILEILVSIGVLMIVLSYSSISVVNNLNSNRNAMVKAEAAQAAQTILDKIRGVKIENLRPDGKDPVQQVPVSENRVYDVEVHYCEEDTFCSATSRQLRVEVRLNDNLVYETKTVYTELAEESKLETTYLTFIPPEPSKTIIDDNWSTAPRTPDDDNSPPSTPVWE